MFKESPEINEQYLKILMENSHIALAFAWNHAKMTQVIKTILLAAEGFELSIIALLRRFDLPETYALISDADALEYTLLYIQFLKPNLAALLNQAYTQFLYQSEAPSQRQNLSLEQIHNFYVRIFHAKPTLRKYLLILLGQTDNYLETFNNILINWVGESKLTDNDLIEILNLKEKISIFFRQLTLSPVFPFFNRVSLVSFLAKIRMFHPQFIQHLNQCGVSLYWYVTDPLTLSSQLSLNDINNPHLHGILNRKMNDRSAGFIRRSAYGTLKDDFDKNYSTLYELSALPLSFAQFRSCYFVDLSWRHYRKNNDLTIEDNFRKTRAKNNFEALEFISGENFMGAIVTLSDYKKIRRLRDEVVLLPVSLKTKPELLESIIKKLTEGTQHDLVLESKETNLVPPQTTNGSFWLQSNRSLITSPLSSEECVELDPKYVVSVSQNNYSNS